MTVAPRSTIAERGMSKWMMRFFVITHVAVLKLRYEFPNVSHSCGMVPYPSAIIAHTPIAPRMVFAHVADSAGLGLRVQTYPITTPIVKMSDDQISRPA